MTSVIIAGTFSIQSTTAKSPWLHFKTGDLLKKVPIHMKFSMTGKEKKLLYK
jgi:hypothetical protein